MPKLKILFFLGLFLFLVKFFTGSALAQADPGSVEDYYFNPQTFKEAVQQSAGGQINYEGWSLKGTSNVVEGAACLIDGGCFAQDGQPSGAGAINTVGNLTALLFVSPVDSGEYFAYLKNQINPVKPAYAAAGQQALSPIVSLWAISRNTTYLFFIVIFVAVGFMIMFRTQLNPQTVVSVQLALPKIILSLILVTFSFAIIAFIIDLSELLLKLIANLYIGFVKLAPTDTASDWLNIILGKTTSPNSTTQQLERHNIFSLVSSLNTGENLGGSINAVVSDTGSAIVDALSSIGAIDSLARLVLAIAVISSMFKTFFGLLTAYVSLILSAIFSPFAFLLTAFPNGKGSSFGLIKSVLANVLVFPATFGFLFIGAIIASSVGSPWNIDQSIAPSFGNSPWLPFGLSGLNQPGSAVDTVGKLIQSLISFGVILALPRVPEIIKEVLQVKESSALAAAGESFKGAFSQLPLVGSFVR